MTNEQRPAIQLRDKISVAQAEELANFWRLSLSDVLRIAISDLYWKYKNGRAADTKTLPPDPQAE